MRDGNPLLIPHVAWLFNVLSREIQQTYDREKEEMRTAKKEGKKGPFPTKEFFLLVELSPE